MTRRTDMLINIRSIEAHIFCFLRRVGWWPRMGEMACVWCVCVCGGGRRDEKDGMCVMCGRVRETVEKIEVKERQTVRERGKGNKR